MKVGDQVTWMKSGRSGSTLSFSTRRGTIEAIKNDVATVKPPSKNAKRVQVHVSRLRLESQPSELTEALSGIFPSLRKEKEGEG